MKPIFGLVKNNRLRRFDNIIGTGANQIPPGTTITAARLLMTIVDSGDVAALHEILPGTAGESTDFDDTTTTYEMWGDGWEPWPDVHYAGDPVADVPGSTGLLELDVTSSVAKYSAGEANLGWIIVPTGGGGVDAISSEAYEGFGSQDLARLGGGFAARIHGHRADGSGLRLHNSVCHQAHTIA